MVITAADFVDLFPDCLISREIKAAVEKRNAFLEREKIKFSLENAPQSRDKAIKMLLRCFMRSQSEMAIKEKLTTFKKLDELLRAHLDKEPFILSIVDRVYQEFIRAGNATIDLMNIKKELLACVKKTRHSNSFFFRSDAESVVVSHETQRQSNLCFE
jgi:hypothetical protein